ncbi:MAG: cytochrome c [Gammaproteobacteria bacterium]|nr:cytochrome c [Gammaproteobacteria bacterium]
MKNHTAKINLMVVLLAFLLSGVAHAGNPGEGAKKYNRYCTGCHGSGGRGAIPGVPDFTRGEGLLQSDIGLLSVLKAGKGMMPAFMGRMNETEMLDVIAYLRTLR